jgi:hypothetical protein
MIERIVTFLILGFFVFGPQVQSFWSDDPITWYRNYVVWLALIGACFWTQHRSARLPRK